MRALVAVFVSGCGVLGPPCGSGYECPVVPDEPAVQTYNVDFDAEYEEVADGVLEVLDDAVVLEFTDDDGNTWRTTWAR